ncbi:tyrosine-type recombinase/integrase [Marinobacter sp.]|uniref:tyrosine-type recombinase/integrase n=1 Tax=Marinobacter sp. TaxID=50741 RepID=UPI00384B1F90
MKRTAIKRRPLADSVIKALEPETSDYRERDSRGLYLTVKKTGHKSWVLRYKRPNGKWAWMGLGGFPAVSAKKARKDAAEWLALASDGIDLREYKNGVQGKPTFREAAEEWYDRKLAAGRATGTTRQMRIYLDKDVLPFIGDKALDEVTRSDCAAIQARLEKRDAYVMAGKVGGWLRQIYSLAIGQGKCELNPASELRGIAVDKPAQKQYPHLLEPELPDFLKAMNDSVARFNSLVLLRLVMRTASRPGMARFAEWSEIDLDKGEWVIPADKMKMRRDHVVPLAQQSIDDLRELKEMTGLGRYVFPGFGPKNPTMSENTIKKVIAQIGYEGRIVSHGFRHTASTLLREHGWPRDYVEVQLAHVESGVAGVYNKAQYLEKRREMMQWYADYLDSLEAGTGDQPKDPVLQLPA